MRYLLLFAALPLLAGDLDKALSATCKALPPDAAQEFVDWAKANKRGDSCPDFLKAMIRDTRGAIAVTGKLATEAANLQKAAEVAKQAETELVNKRKKLEEEIQ
jgi:hypothetical protein